MAGFSDDNKRPLLGLRVAPILKLVVVVALSIALMMADHTRHTLASVRNVLSEATEPLQYLAELPGDAASYLQKYFDRDELIQKNEALSQKVLLLQGQLQKMAALQTENDRIRALLASASTMDRNVLIARILSASPEPYRQYIKLNKGSSSGVFVGQALIDSHGIVGQVTQVTPLSSRAVLITDPNTGIPVQDNKTGLLAIAQGTGNTHKLTLPYLPHNADIHVGDLLVSSGLGGRYPANYPVARISKIDRHAGGEFLAVWAKPTARLVRGREVLLIWNTPASEDQHSDPATPDDETATGKHPARAQQTPKNAARQ